MHRNEKRNRWREAFAAVWGLLFVMAPAMAQTDSTVLFEGGSEEAKKLIVRITAENGIEGSGIVVNVDGKYVYGVTAKHVLMARGKPAQDLKARLRMWRQALPLELDRGHPLKDLAAFKVDYSPLGLSEGELRASLNFEQLGSSRIDAGSAVYTIGHAAGGAWVDSQNPLRLASSDVQSSDMLAFQYFCPPGHSGGGLFDGQWRLVGMITDNQEPFCHALRIESVLASLGDWSYEYQLEPAPSREKGPAAPEDITVAVVDFDNRSGADIQSIGPAGRDITTSFLSNLPGVTLVTRDRLASVNRELYVTGTKGSVEGASRVGKLVEADALVTGSVNRYDVERRTFKGYNTTAATDTYRMSITLQVIHVDTGVVKFSKTYDVERKTSYAQATSAPREPMSRESELLEELLEIQAKEEVQQALRELASGLDKGRLIAVPIATVPEGAEVVVSGIYQGTTPVTIQLMMGVHEIEIRKRGYAFWRKRVKVEPDFRLDVHLSPDAQ